MVDYIERIYDFAVVYGGLVCKWPSYSYWIVPNSEKKSVQRVKRRIRTAKPPKK